MAIDLSVEDEGLFWDQLRERDRQMQTYRANAVANPQLAANLTAIHNAAPDAAPGVKLSLAQGTAAGLMTRDQAIAAAMTTYAVNVQEGVAKAVTAGVRQGQTSWADQIVSDLHPMTAIKGLVRTGLGVLQSGGQLLQTSVVAQNPTHIANQRLAQGHEGSPSFGVVGDQGPIAPLATPGDIVRSTTLGQQVSDLGGSGTTDQGSGFFPGGAAEIKRREAERRVRGVIPGSGRLDANGNVIPGSEQTKTIGRTMAATVFEPGTAGYRIMSGAADAYVGWYLDPANIVLSEANAARKARNVFTAAKGLETSDIARVLRPGERITTTANRGEGVWRDVMHNPTFVPLSDLQSEARALRQSEAGVIEAHRATFAPRQAETWLQTDKGQQIVQSIADDPNFRSIHHALGSRVAPEVVQSLAEAKTPEAVREILLGELGTSIRSTTDISRVKAPNWWQSTRASQIMPKAHLSTGFNQSTAERIDAVNTLDSYMSNAKVDKLVGAGTQSKILGEFAKGLVTNAQDRYQALNNALNAVEKALLARKVDAGIARSLTHFSDDVEAVRKYSLTAQGMATDGGFLEYLKGQGYTLGEASATLKALGPMLLSEGLSDTAYLPNIREIRRLTSHFGALLSKTDFSGARTGELWHSLAAVEHFQNAIIKPLAIIRPAFLLRVIGEEQFRMAAAGQASIVRHPIEWIQYAMHNSGSYDAMGRDFAALAHHAEDYKKWDELSAALHRGIGGRGAKHVIDPLAAEKQSYETGSWSTVDKHVEPDLWDQGLSDELRQLHNDPFASRVAEGQTNDEITTWLRSADPEAQRVSAELKNLLANKAARDQNGKWVSVYTNSDDDVVLHAYLDSVRDRVATKAGQNPDLLAAIAHGSIGHAEQTVANTDLTVIAAGPHVDADPFNPSSKGSTWIGSKVKLPDGSVGTVANDATEAGHSIVRVGAQAWDRAGRTTPQLRAAAKDWRAADGSPQVVKYSVRANERVAGYRGETGAAVAKMRDKVVNGFFSGLYGRSSDYLSRSPSWRQFYWQRATELADKLSPEEANKFLHSMEAAAASHTENSVAKLLGGNKAVDDAIAAAGRANGTVTLEQLDNAARGYALDKTKALLYDASRRTQWADIARVIFPFGEAWKEVVGAWSKAIRRDPRLVRRAQLIVQGGRDYDPDGNGQGFFHVDPATGQEVFTLPFSSEVSRYLTGNSALEKTLSPIAAAKFGGAVPVSQPMNVQLKNLNIGMSVLPGIGWVASAALGKIIPDKPAFDDVRNFLLPYGSNTLTGAAIIPSWAQKIAQGLTDSPNGTRIYGDTYMRTVQYLASTGEYGTSADEQDRLKSDATKQARALTIIRGVAQATGPAAPSIDFKVHTQGKDQGAGAPPEMDVMASALTKEYARMQQEDPQNALENFTALYGDLATSYTVGRTRSVNGGLDDSKKFGDWERTHGKVFSQAPDVAGYLAPVGDDFSFAVYDRQLKTGQREKLSANEYLSAVNEVMGNRQYYALRDTLTERAAAVGRKTLNDTERQYLAAQKAKILAVWPVPNPHANDRAALVDQIRQLNDVIDSNALPGNEIVAAASDYLALRDRVLAVAKTRGYTTLQSAGVSDLRAYLSAQGAKVAQHTPGFSRLWERVLSREVEA